MEDKEDTRVHKMCYFFGGCLARVALAGFRVLPEGPDSLDSHSTARATTRTCHRRHTRTRGPQIIQTSNARALVPVINCLTHRYYYRSALASSITQNNMKAEVVGFGSTAPEEVCVSSSFG